MVGELITLPVRIGVRVTRLWMRAAEETVSIATSATGRVIGLASRRAGGTAEPERPVEQSNGRSALDTQSERRRKTGTIDEFSTPARPPSQPEPPLTAPPSALDAEAGPRHVSEEPSLVDEYAEPGAENGAGAEVHVEEPWDGYGEMNAKQIVERLGPATPAELAAVQLYESSHRGRQTVLNAVQRELRNANGRSSGSQQRG